MQTYVLDGDPTIINNNNVNTGPFTELDSKKVTLIDTLPTEAQDTINLDSNFALSKQDINFLSEVSIDNLTTDFSTYIPINDTYNSLKFYSSSDIPNDFHNLLASYMRDIAPGLNDLSGKTNTIVVDSTGLAYNYNLTTIHNLNIYTPLVIQRNKDLVKYNSFYLDPKNATKINPETRPFIQPNQNLRFKSSELTDTSDLSLYTKYYEAFPLSCADDVNTYVTKNISDTDLKKIGNLYGVDIYTLIDTNNPLNKLSYDLKTSFSLIDFQQINNTTRQIPTFAQYVAKNPLLFMKDPFGRWDIAGEYDYGILGGCGKPVVYLYPSKPTNVSVSLVDPVSFTTDIPTYNNGWKVNAEPNGTLHDLQPQFTDCNKLNTSILGSEYAKNACINNSYPYLYWSGNVTSLDYPNITDGWIVSKTDLNSFMNNKLDEVGLTSKEKNDMLSYWLPEMLGKDSPYYRISFLQTAEMNKIAPMHISPTPDNIFRIFLDYLPLNSKPTTSIQSEVLNKIVRNGFTVVEWGGKKI